jgi:excisionase family DNA binding protein
LSRRRVHRLDAIEAGHLALALARHRSGLEAEGREVPAVLVDLLLASLSAARSGQTVLLRPGGAHDPNVSLLDYSTAAEVASVSERTIRRRVATGELRARRIGRRVLIHPDDLASWLDAADTKETA